MLFLSIYLRKNLNNKSKIKMSRADAYDKTFGSDIFNQKVTNSSKRNTIREKLISKNNDVFNQHIGPIPKRNIRREKQLAAYSHDIFNKSCEPIPQPTNSTRTRDGITKGSDIFNSKQEQPLKVKRKNKRPNLNESDIFNQRIISDRRRIRNHSQSDIFFTQGKVVDDMFPKEKKYESNYDPDLYYNCITAYEAKMNEIYRDGLSPEKELPLNTIGSSKGFLCRTEDKNSHHNRCITALSEANNVNKSFKKLKSPFEMKTGSKNMARPRLMMVSDMASNIFNDDNLEKKKEIFKPSVFPRARRDTRDLTQPKKCRGTTKWVAKMDWTSPDGELIFKTFNPKNNTNGKTLEIGDHSFAYEKKKIDMSDSFNPNPYCTYRPENTDKSGARLRIEEEKLNNELSAEPRLPKCKYECEQKLMYDKMSHLKTYNDDYFKVIEKVKNHTIEATPKEKVFVVKHGDKINKEDLEKYYQQKGIHIYNVKEANTFLKEKDDARNTISFSIREQDMENKMSQRSIKEAAKELNKKNGVEITPMKKISVNRKRGINDDFVRIKNTHKLNTNAIRGIDDGSHRVLKNNNTVNSSFSKKFQDINHRYKSDTKRLKVE